MHAQSFINEETARTIALQCVHYKFYPALMNNSHQYDISSVQLVRHSDSTPLYYIVSLSPQGWIIVSATRTYHPIIAFSWESTFEYPIYSPAVSMWMWNEQQKIRQSLRHVTSHPLIQSEWLKYEQPDAVGARFRDEKIVLPMLNTKWNQGMFYNEFCPRDPAGPDGRTYAGCVATAIGQVMNYFRYPLQGQGGTYTSQYTAYGTLTVDYSSALYHWNMMPWKLSRSNHPVAQLLYHIGVSVDMHYGPYGSGMWNHKAAHTMKTFFGYSDSTQYIFRDTTSINWSAMLRHFLDQKIVLYYAGWADSQYVSGHAFVCDGYQDSTFFHFNWGWGGAYDGYFNIDHLFVGGYDFSTMHEAVINATPAYNYPYFCSDTDTLTTLDGTIEDGSGPLYNYLNNASCRWLIAPDDTVEYITLWFDKCNLTDNDVVRIYNGPTDSSPLLAVATSSFIPSQMQSSSKYVLVEFISNDSLSGDGFLLNYSAKQIKTCSGLKTLTAPSGYISDGSGKYNYQNSNVCRWKIEPPGTTFFQLKFLEFDIDSTDILKIVDLSNNQTIGQYQGNVLPDDITIWTNAILITFTSSPTSNAKGFELYYQTSQQNIDEWFAEHIRVYPNPTTNLITIELPATEPSLFDVQILTPTGKIILHQTIQSPGTFTYTLNAPHGIYFLRLQNNRFSYVKKIVVVQ